MAHLASHRKEGDQMKRLFMCFLVLILIFTLSLTASAEEYSTSYPWHLSHNSGSPVWLHCNLDGYGEVLIVLDPRTDLKSFGFDSPNGYNLINNTGATISARCYRGNTSVSARWTSFYKLQLQTGESSYNQTSWEDYDIAKIFGTTLDLVDYTEQDRGNDYYDGLPVEYRDTLVVFVSGSIIVTLLNFFLWRRGHR